MGRDCCGLSEISFLFRAIFLCVPNFTVEQFFLNHWLIVEEFFKLLDDELNSIVRGNAGIWDNARINGKTIVEENAHVSRDVFNQEEL